MGKAAMTNIGSFNSAFSEAVPSALALGWQTESEQQDVLLRRRFLKRKVACRELFSNYHGD
jgi:hypothetical protein